jgi:Na+-driven multidrug efflux pump
LITACLVNIALDLLFVAVFQWGVFGVALATVTAQLVSAILVVRELMTTDGIHKLDIKQIRVNKKMLLRIMRIGVPSGLQNSLYALSHLLIQSNVNAFGTDTMAAWSAFIKVDAIYWMIGGAFNSATLTFSGRV